MKDKLSTMLTPRTRALSLALALAAGLALGLIWFLNVPNGVRSDQAHTPSWAASADQITDTLEEPDIEHVITSLNQYEALGQLRWERFMGSPVPSRLFAIAMVSDTLGWAMGDEGAILQYDGSSWETVESPSTYRLYDLVMTSASNGWAVGDYGTVLRFLNGRWAVWPQQLPNVNLHAVAMADLDAGWAVGRAGTILMYDGESWNVMESPTSFSLNDVVSVRPASGFAVGGGGTILAWRDGTWTVESSPTSRTLNAVAMVTHDAGWAVGDRGTILRYNDAAWSPVDSPTDDPLHDLVVVGPNDIWAAGEAGLLIHYDGAAWSQATSPAMHSLYGLTRAPGGELWAVGFSATILRHRNDQWESATRVTSSDLHGLLWDSGGGWAVGEGGEILHNNGEGWLRINGPTPATLYALGQAAPGDLWAIGDHGIILHNAGSGWTSVTSPTTLTLRALSFNESSEGWAVGGEQQRSAQWSAGVILHYDGFYWNIEPVAPEEPLHALVFAADDRGWAMGDEGAIWRYDGDDWSAENSPTDCTIRSAAAVSVTDIWAVGDTGAILHYDGDTWRQVESPTDKGLHKIMMTTPSAGWALGDSGTILHYDGLGWHTIPSPTKYRLLGGIDDGGGNLWAVGDDGTLLQRRLTSGGFRIIASSQHLFATPGTTSWVTLTISAVDGFRTPITMEIRGPLDVLTPSWSTAIVTPSVQVGLSISLPATTPSPHGDTLSLDVIANSGEVTDAIGLSLTVLPGEWLPGLTLQSSRRMHDLAYDGEEHAWSVGDDGLAWRYNGVDWRRYRLGTSEDLYAVEALSPTLVWAAGEKGTLLRFDGTEWSKASSPTTMPLFGLVFLAPDDGWAVGGGGTVLHYDGHSWNTESPPGQDWLYDVAMASDGTGWAVGWGGVIWHYDGFAWQAAKSPTSRWLRAVNVIGPEEAWAVGSEGAILHYVTGQWHATPSPTPARLLDVHFDDSNNGWAAGGDGTILYYDGSGWQVLASPGVDDLRAFDEIGSGYGLAVGNGGSVVCYRAVEADLSSPPGCDGEPVSQTLQWSHQAALPLVSQGSHGKRAIDLFGVQTMGGTFSRDPAIVHQMAEAGIRWARLPFSWKLIEPHNTSPDQFHWSVYDDWLELLSMAGVQPQPFLARNPSWAGALPASSIDQSDESEQRAFVEAAVTRYSQSPYNVSHWEMYNEPDNVTLTSAEVGWGMWGDDGAGYADQLAALYPTVKETDPSAHVLLGGIAHDYFVEDGGSFARSFITDVLSAGGGAYFDLMNFHYYGPDLTKRIETFEDMMTTFGLDKPIACTEVSKSLGDPVLEEEGELYARYLPKVMMRGLAEGLPIVHWFALSDMESVWRPGLFALDRTTRPAYRVYEVLTELLRDATYLRPVSDAEKRGMPLEGYVFNVPEGGGRLDIVWAREGGIVDWQVRSPSVDLIDKYGQASSIFDSDDHRTDGLTTLQVGADPLYVVYRPEATRPVGELLGTSIWPAPEIPSQIHHAQNAGANWIRINIYWDDIEPIKTTPRTYEWEVTDSRILSVTAAGINPIALIGGNPAWAATYPGGPVTDTQDITAFLEATAERYDGDGYLDAPGSPIVQVWELYNEPDNQDPKSMVYRGYGSWGGKGEEYAQLLKLAREALRSANPRAQLAAGGLAHEDLGRPAFDLAFPDAVFSYIHDHPGDYFDFFNFHFFPWFGKAYSDWGSDIIGKTAYFREWMDRYGLRWPIIVTEAGNCSSSVLGEPWTGSYEDQAAYVLKLFAHSAAADLRATVWLLVADLSVDAYCRHGLSGTDGTPKPAYNAYQTVADRLGDLHFERTLSSLDLGTPNAEGYAFADPNTPRQVYVIWTTGPQDTGTLRVSAPSVVVSDKLSSQWPMSPTISSFEPYTILDGDDGSEDGYTRVEFGHSPIYVDKGH